MKFGKILMSSAVVVAAFSGTQAIAADGASGITYSGAVDVSYDFAKNDSVDGSGGAAVRQFDLENDGFVFHQANLTASKSFDGGVSATVNAIAGDDANLVSGDGGTDDFDLTQAFISKSMGNLTVNAGRFVTLAGMEVINPSGNMNASRSLLFFNQPLVHTGVRASYKLSDMLTLTAGLNNAQFGGTKAAGVDNNTDQTLEAQVALTPMKNLSVYLTGYSGNVDNGAPGADADLRNDTIDLVVNLSVTDTLYLGLNADYFNTEDGAGGNVEAKGVAGYAQVKFMPKWRVAVRSEYLDFDDENAAGGSANYLRSNTLTLAHACTDNLELLVEGRHDRASGDANDQIFDVISSGAEEDQYTGTIKAILKF